MGPMAMRTRNPSTSSSICGSSSKHKWLIAGIALLFFAVTAVSTFMMTPIYRATASIQIERKPRRSTRRAKSRRRDTASYEFYQTQYQLLSSRSLAERVAAALRLAEDDAFNTAVSPTLFNLIRGKLTGFVASLIFSAEKPTPEDQSASVNAVSGRQDQGRRRRGDGGAPHRAGA